MNDKKIKTNLASISKTSGGNFVVCLRNKTAVKSFYFDSAEQLRDALESAKLSVGKWIIAASAQKCICKELSLPADNLEQAVKMAEFELESLLPLPVNQLVYGCAAMKSSGDLAALMVYILKLNVLEELCSSYKQIGIIPERISVDDAAIGCWFNRRRAESDVNIDVLISEDVCLVLFSVGGNLHDTQRVNIRNNPGWADEVEEAVAGIGKKNSQNKASGWLVTIAGDNEIAGKLKDILEDKQDGVEGGDISVIQPPIVSRWAESEDGDGPGNCRIEAVTAAGLMETVEDDRLKYLDLIPKSQREKARKIKLIFNGLSITILSTAVLAGLWLCMQAINWRIDRQCQQLQAKISPIEHIADTVESKRQRLKAIQNQFAGRGVISRIFEELYSFSPANISISQLNFQSRTDSAVIDIKGQSDSLSEAFEYADSMEQARLLKQINITNVQQSPVAGGSIVEFRASCAIRSD